jgi:hypothetical protein
MGDSCCNCVGLWFGSSVAPRSKLDAHTHTHTVSLCCGATFTCERCLLRVKACRQAVDLRVCVALCRAWLVCSIAFGLGVSGQVSCVCAGGVLLL